MYTSDIGLTRGWWTGLRVAVRVRVRVRVRIRVRVNP